jgi:hypothetical protein
MLVRNYIVTSQLNFNKEKVNKQIQANRKIKEASLASPQV